MWYTEFLRIAATKEEYLSSIGISHDIINWISSIPSNLAQFYVNELRKNRNLSLTELKQIHPEQKRTYEFSQDELNIANRYSDPFRTWVKAQLRKKQ